MMWIGEPEEKIIQNTHQPGVTDTTNTYFDLFWDPVSKFQVQHHWFYLLKQEYSERI